MALTTGTRLGPYEITAPLGAGGMGEVYRARDLKLGREVTLKILPDVFAGDAERLARFEREAKTLASLNHPHIAQIFGFEQSNGMSALVMELVDGEDLSQHIARGAIPPDEAVRFARQIIDALEAAHEAGIIHRDLKPGNVKVRGDGTVKILDFGLAKVFAAEGPGASPANSLSITSPMTMHGMNLGTAAYMAPEQAKGKPVDKRADVWAFGCVFYEMLTGKALFSGENVSETIADVLTKDVDLQTLPSATPLNVRRVIARCLERNPRNRLRDIGDARLELNTPAPRDEGVSDSASRALWVLAVVAVGGLALAVFLALRTGQQTTTPRGGPIHFTASQPGLSVFQDAGISPDGTRIAFRGAESGAPQLWVRALHEPVAVPIPNTEGGRLPVWSPDGSEVAFFNARGLVAVQVASGLVRTISSDVVAPADVGSVTWSSDGTLLVGESSPSLVRVDATTGVITPISDSREFRYPVLLPTGTHFIFTARKADANVYGIGVAPVSDPSQRRLLIGVPSRAQYANGHLVYVRDGTLMAQPFDLSLLELTGTPFALAGDVTHFRPTGRAAFWAAADTIVYMTPDPDVDAVVMARSGAVLGTFGQSGQYGDLAISPDGTRAIIGLTDRRTGVGDLYLYDLAGRTSTRVTTDEASEGSTVWAPDGRSIVYGSDRDGGPPDVYRLDLASGGEARRIWSAPGTQYPRAWLPDGRLLIADVAEPSGNSVVLTLGASPTRAIFQPPVPAGRSASQTADVSPDGRWIAFSASESGPAGRLEVFVQPLSRPGPRVRVSRGGGVAPQWRSDGSELFFRIVRDLMVTEVAKGDQFSFTPPRVLFSLDRPIDRLEVAPDGQRFLVVPGPPPGFAPMHVLVDWSSPAGAGPSIPARSSR